MTRRLSAAIRTVAIAALVTALAAPQVQARAGGSKSSGSRGSFTQSAPPSTATAPKGAQPMQRTETPNVGAPAAGMAGTAAAAAPRRMGFGTGLMAGLFGAGLLGMMFGGGLTSGLGGLASMFGLLLQIGLVVGLVYLAIRFFRRRQEPALAGAGAPYARQAFGGLPGGSGHGPASGGPSRSNPQPIEIAPRDFEAFERALNEVQISYGRGDLSAIRRLSTPEMARYFEQDLAEDRARGVRNEIEAPKLLQGDLAQSWREGPVEYATVAMRFEILEAYVDIASGKVVSGNRTAPTETTELWTFRRENGGSWIVSAVQQTA